MSSHRALVVIAGLVLSVAAQAQQEPPLIYTGPSGRPAGGRGIVNVDPGQKPDLIHTTVVVQPKPAGNPQTYAILEVKGGLPIVLTAADVQSFVNSKQGSQGQLAGDVNEDEDDFVVVKSDNTVLVLQGAVGDVTGSTVTGLFASQTIIDLTPLLPQGSATPSPRLVATVRANGDNLDDIVVAGPDGVKLYLNTSIGEVPSFSLAPQGSLPCSLLNVTDIAVGDVTGDTLDDIAISSGSSTSPTGLGAGVVQIWKRVTPPGVGFTAGPALSFDSPVASVELVKLRTGFPADLVVARHVFSTGLWSSGIVSVHLNPGSPDPNNPGNGNFGIVPFDSFTRWSNTGTVPTFGAAGRIDSDDDLDLVFTESDNIAFPPGHFAAFNPPLMLLHVENHLNETTPAIVFTMRTTRFTGRAVDPIFMESEQPGTIVPMPDHLLLTWTADQNAGMGTEGLPPADENLKLSFHATGTCDGDRFDVPDHVTFETGSMPGDGATAEVAVGTSGIGGSLDIVVPSLDENSLTVALGDGAGGFDDLSAVTNIATPPAFYVGGPRRVVLTDLTHDGFADAVVLSDYIDPTGTDMDSVITVLHSNGHTGLSKLEEQHVEDSGEMAVADIDGDGKKDVVVARHLGAGALQQIWVYFGSAAGGLDHFRAPYFVGLDPGTAGLTGGLGIADVDGDTDPDVVVSYARLMPSGTAIQSGVAVFRNDWSSAQALRPVENVFSTGVDVPDVESLVLGQVNGTSAIDVAVGLRNGTLLFARGNGTAGGFQKQSIDIESSTQGGGSLALADLNGDTQMDIVSCKGAPAPQSVVQVLIATATNDFAVSELAGWNPEDYDGAIRPIVGDFDGDPRPDIAIVHFTGEVTVLLAGHP